MGPQALQENDALELAKQSLCYLGYLKHKPSNADREHQHVFRI